MGLYALWVPWDLWAHWAHRAGRPRPAGRPADGRFCFNFDGGKSDLNEHCHIFSYYGTHANMVPFPNKEHAEKVALLKEKKMETDRAEQETQLRQIAQAVQNMHH